MAATPPLPGDHRLASNHEDTVRKPRVGSTDNTSLASNQDDVIPKPVDGSSASAESQEYPPLSKVLAIMACLMLTSFLFALDRTIIATAIPIITDHFNSLDDVGWYASAYLLTMSAFQLLMGRVYTFYNPKWVYIACVAVFELGSLICGVAPTSTALIIGRAVAGLGSAGLFSGIITIVVYIVPLRQRPAWTGLFGAVFAVASVAGPLLGGVFADKLSWRWCFYINLPVGGATMLLLAYVLHLPNAKRNKVPIREQINQLDPLGTLIFIPAIVCLLLALQWGGITYPWSDARIIALLVLSGVLFLGFIAIQMWRQEIATIPPRILKIRSITAGVIYSFFSGAGMMSMIFFLPVWFQAIKGASAVHSGIMNLPAVLAISLAGVLAGVGTKMLGYYTAWMYLSAVLTPIGAGLISSFTTTTPHQQWIGYQVLWGFGLGVGMQQSAVAAQTVLARKDVPTGAAMMFFAQTLGGSIFVSVANNILTNQLAQGLQSVPGIDPDLVAHVGATDLRRVVPPQYLDAVLVVYNSALQGAFYVSTAVSSATVIGALLMKWTNLKKVAAQQAAEAKAIEASAPNSGTHSGDASAEQQSSSPAEKTEV